MPTPRLPVPQVVLERALPAILRNDLDKTTEQQASPLLLVIRCERFHSLKGGAGSRERLLVVTSERLALYREEAKYFAHLPWTDVEADKVGAVPDGSDMLTREELVDLDAISSAALESGVQPRVTIGRQGGSNITLQFADDTGAALFRHCMSDVLAALGGDWVGEKE